MSRDEVEQRLKSGPFFWLDLPNIGEEELTWMREVFSFHPLAIEDAEHFHQRPKVEDYDGYLMLVLYGSAVSEVDPATPGGPDINHYSADDLERLSEIHFFVSERYMVTVHEADCHAFRGLTARMHSRRVTGLDPSKLFYRVADTLVDSFFPVLSELDDRIDTLQAQVIQKPTNQQLGQLLAYKSSLIELRRVIAPQRDLFATVSSGVVDLPGSDTESARYYRDIYDHLIRLSDLVDSYRDLLSSTTDAYLSVVSNRLNEVMKQLTIIATIFLPLSFLTGFFGQNFGWLVSELGSFGVFLGLGLGTELLAVIILVVLFYRRGWVGSRA